MTIYRYIYYTILSFYKRFSKDPQINIFAMGFFSVIIFFKVLSLWGIYKYYIAQNYSLEPLFMIASGGVIFFFNTYYFLFNRGRQNEYYERYCKQRSTLGTTLVAGYIVFVFALTIWVATKHREKNIEKKQQKITLINNAPSFHQ